MRPRRERAPGHSPLGRGPDARARFEAARGGPEGRKGDIYFTDEPGRRIYFLPQGGRPRVLDEGIGAPNGVLSADQSLLVVDDTRGQPNLDELYETYGSGVYERKLRRKGVLSRG